MLARQVETAITLDIPFRGERDYVHSTDLFSALDGLGREFAPGSFLKNLVLRRLARRQVQAYFAPRSDAFGTFTLATPERAVQGWLVESRSPILRRIAFDETAIARAATAEPGWIFLSAAAPGHTGFEQMIVLFKMLCAQSHAGAWLFTALDLTRPLRADAPIALRQSQTVLGRLIVADLYQDHQPVGRVQMVLSQTAEGIS